MPLVGGTVKFILNVSPEVTKSEPVGDKLGQIVAALEGPDGPDVLHDALMTSNTSESSRKIGFTISVLNFSRAFTRSNSRWVSTSRTPEPNPFSGFAAAPRRLLLPVGPVDVMSRESPVTSVTEANLLLRYEIRSDDAPEASVQYRCLTVLRKTALSPQTWNSNISSN